MLKVFSDLILSDSIDDLNTESVRLQGYLLLFFCKKGTIQVTIDDKPWTVSEGDLLVCMPQSLIGHYLRTPDLKGMVLLAGEHLFDDTLSDCIRMEPNWWEKQKYVLTHPVFHLGEYHQRLLTAYANLLLTYMDDVETEYRQRILRNTSQSAAYEILHGLDPLISAEESSGTLLEKETGQKDRVFKKFLTLLNAPGNTEREVRAYADKLLLTPKYLSAVCREKSGSNASELITEVTVGHIRHYLQHTDLSIKEIAYKLDFPDVSFFCKYTKKHLGYAPLEFRRIK